MSGAIIILINFCLVFLAIASSPAVIDSQLPRALSPYQLQTNLNPIHYDLMLDTGDFTTPSEFFPMPFNGEVAILFEVLQTTSVVELNCRDIDIEWDSVRIESSVNGNPMYALNHQHSVPYEKCIFNFPEQLLANERYQIIIKYDGQIRRDFKGLYRSSYNINTSRRFLLVTQFQPTYARMMLPCFDEPGYRSTFSLRLRHLSQYQARSNMPVYNTTELANNYHLTAFEETVPMPTYLLAFVVSSLDSVTATSNGITFSVLAPENQMNGVNFALQYSQQVLAELSSLLKHPYQLAKLDLAAVPDHEAGAMENWGLVIANRKNLLYTPGVTAARAHQSISNLIAHELTHKWFGNEVTPELWQYLWLSEGLARYFEFYAASRVEPSWRLWEQFVVLNVQSALAQDITQNGRPMTLEAFSPTEIEERFDFVAYSKSASVFRMIQNIIGMENFLRVLDDYISQRSYKTTNPDYFLTSLEKFLPPFTVDIDRLWNSWATTPGYPVVKVERDYNNYQIRFSQKRFFAISENVQPEDNKGYYIPINYIAQNDAFVDFENTMSTYWLTPTGSSMSILFTRNDEWIIVNKQQTGFYRVNYDNDNWHMIINALNGPEYEKIHVLNRAQLIDDAANLAKENELDYKIALRLMNYLEYEVDYIPWSTAYNAIAYLIRLFGGNENYPRFETFLRNITEKVFSEIGLVGDDSHVAQLNREYTSYLACFVGVESCVELAVDYVSRTIQNPSFQIPVAIQSTVFCAAVKHDSSMTNRLTNYLTSLLLNAGNRDQIEDYLYRVISGLGCTNDITNINTAIELSLTPIPGNLITQADRTHIFTSVVSGSYAGALAGLNTILNRWGAVSNSYTSMANTINIIAPRIVTQEMVDIFSAIVQANSPQFETPVRLAVENAQKTIIENMAWVGRYSDNIAEWLIENEFDLPPSPTIPPGGDGGGANAIDISSFLIILMLCLRKLMIE